VRSKPERNAQTEYELNDFCCGVTKVAPLVERPQSEGEMNYCRGIERAVDERNAPPPNVPAEPRFHYWVGNVAKRVIEEMRKDVREHHKAAGKTNLAHGDAAQPRCDPRPGAETTGAHIKNGRCLYRHDWLF
jgi:hypothetical protein